jgi:uncharacterized protein Yka (UPF0111/DUF47 family)
MPVDDLQAAESVHEAIQQVDTLLKTGQADQIFSASAGKVQEAVKKLRQAEEFDPQMLRLTVTI